MRWFLISVDFARREISLYDSMTSPSPLPSPRWYPPFSPEPCILSDSVIWRIERYSLAIRPPSPSRASVDYLTDYETQPPSFIVDDVGFAPVIFAPGIYISCTRYLSTLRPSTLGPPAPTSTVTLRHPSRRPYTTCRP
jgi:hypothetical protein